MCRGPVSPVPTTALRGPSDGTQQPQGLRLLRVTPLPRAGPGLDPGPRAVPQAEARLEACGQCSAPRACSGAGFSLVVACGLSSCGAWASLPCGMWDLSSLTRDRTRVPCVGRRILNHWTASEAPRARLLTCTCRGLPVSGGAACTSSTTSKSHSTACPRYTRAKGCCGQRTLGNPHPLKVLRSPAGNTCFSWV